jgi:hypothetical protein
MSETTGQGRPSADYQQAQPVSAQGSATLQTSHEIRSSRTTVVVPTGQTVHMRIVPRPPRQTGDEARTD